MNFFGFSKNNSELKYNINDIYAGIVVTPIKYFCDGKKISSIANFSIYPRNVYRKILFCKNKDNCGEDLLYYNCIYKVEGFGKSININNDKFVIAMPIPLGDTLDYFGRAKYVKESEIKSIYNDFLKDDKFIDACSDTFGISEYGFGSFSDHTLDPDVYKGLTLITKYSKDLEDSERENSKIRSRFITL